MEEKSTEQMYGEVLDIAVKCDVEFQKVDQYFIDDQMIFYRFNGYEDFIDIGECLKHAKHFAEVHELKKEVDMYKTMANERNKTICGLRTNLANMERDSKGLCTQAVIDSKKVIEQHFNIKNKTHTIRSLRSKLGHANKALRDCNAWAKGSLNHLNGMD